MSHCCKERKYNDKKKNEKAEKAVDGDEDDSVLFLFMMKIKKEKENIKKKVQFMEDVKKPTETGMMCTIDGDTFFFHKKHLDWTCQIMNNDTSLYDVNNINESIQGSSRNMPAPKKGSFALMTDKLVALKGSILYGL